MYITCLDVEGVLVPEIWIAFAEESGIPELKRTTRDEPDYNKLMRWRLDILKEHGRGIKEIQEDVYKRQVHSRNPDGRTLGSYVDCRSSIDSLPGNGIGCGVYTLVGSAGA